MSVDTSPAPTTPPTATDTERRCANCGAVLLGEPITAGLVADLIAGRTPQRDLGRLRPHLRPRLHLHRDCGHRRRLPPTARAKPLGRTGPRSSHGNHSITLTKAPARPAAENSAICRSPGIAPAQQAFRRRSTDGGALSGRRVAARAKPR